MGISMKAIRILNLMVFFSFHPNRLASLSCPCFLIILASTPSVFRHSIATFHLTIFTTRAKSKKSDNANRKCKKMHESV